MINEEVLLEKLEELIEYNTFDYAQEVPLIHMTFEELENIIANQPKVGEWIPCSVDMPKENKTYLATVYDKATGRRMLKHRECRNGSFKEGGSSRAFPVIAWQPLPEPYKGE